MLEAPRTTSGELLLFLLQIRPNDSGELLLHIQPSSSFSSILAAASLL